MQKRSHLGARLFCLLVNCFIKKGVFQITVDFKSLQIKIAITNFVFINLLHLCLTRTMVLNQCIARSREERQVPCSGFAAMFRTPDGSCNNFEHPSWGSAFMPFLRFLPPDYRYTTQTFCVQIMKSCKMYIC